MMEERRTIKVQFLDYWNTLDPNGTGYLLQQILGRHYELEVSDDPDYVFFSAMGESHWTVSDRCVKIYHTGENVAPDFNACDYAIGFEWMDFGDRYIRIPLYLFYDRDMLDRMVHKHELPPDWDLAAEKPDFCSFVVSNHRNPHRNEAFRKLSEYKKVDSGGRYMNNVGGPVVDKFAFDCRHKFSLCFENGSHSGYTTEKLAQALAARTVPIYWGDPDVGKVFNTKAFVNVADFDSLEAALQRVQELDSNDELYLSVLREPAFLPDAPSIDDELARLEAWLLPIFEQPLEKAWRRNREFFGRIYVDRRLVLARRDRIRKFCRKILGR